MTLFNQNWLEPKNDKYLLRWSIDMRLKSRSITQSLRRQGLREDDVRAVLARIAVVQADKIIALQNPAVVTSE